ncbi:MAG TPA: cytochrome C [Terriglobia bacterium]|nr:cytochrome C [Terriglobia bacterium]
MLRRCVLSLFAAILVFALAGIRPTEAQRGQVQLPEGPGRDLVQASCTSCHALNQVTNSAGYTKEGWAALVGTMVALPKDQADTVNGYLAANFPEKTDRRPTLVPGDVSIKISEWVVPTLGQRSRDPVEAPDGSIWWTGMYASLVGRLDPKTGQMKEYPLPQTARPHTIVPDSNGNIWYTGNSNATLGKLDPATGKITEYKTTARDPHSAVFHRNGMMYFTAQNARVVGRFSPLTGETTEISTEPNPYGIQMAPDGTLWVAFNGTNKIGAVNPDTMAIKYYEVPDASSRIRRLGLASDGTVWYGNSTRGRIGKLNPKTGEIKEWPSPSGPTSHPYALAVINDVVWYNESGMRPDTLVRFDPKTEKFQSWAIPSGVGIVRNMWVTRAGNLLIHQSSSNRVGLVEIR